MAKFLFYDDKIINLLLQDEKPSGGSAVQALGWIHGLSEKGQDVYVMTNAAPAGAIKEACKEIKLVPMFEAHKGIRWLRWLYYRVPHINKEIKHVRPDYLYQGIPGWTSFFLGLICYQLKIKYVLRVSNDFLVDDRFYNSYSRTHRFFQNLGFKLSDSILCQNEYQLNIIKNEFPEKKAFKISNPVYLKPTEGYDDIQAKTYIAWLGLFQYQKNLKLLFEIASLLPGESFMVAGKELSTIDPESRVYLQKLQQLANVKFTGFLHRDQVLPFLAKAKFLLNTSHYEGFSNTFLEAMSVATPVITSQHVNPDGIISNNKIGLVYQDAADLQQQHRALTPETYKSLSDNAMAYVFEHHNYKTLASRLINFLNTN
jgi:glycosyltransferase involved in cell wall biosynthesis